MGRQLVAGPGAALLYVGAGWGQVYFPRHWRFPDAQEQWILALDNNSVHRLFPGGRIELNSSPLDRLKTYPALVLVRVERRSWRDLRNYVPQGVFGATLDEALPADQLELAWDSEPPRIMPGEHWLTTRILRPKTKAR
jgi:hypothetical protein